MNLKLRLYFLFTVAAVLLSQIQRVEPSCSMKCHNNGTCVTLLDLFSWCVCVDSYRGAYCEQCPCFTENKTCSLSGNSVCFSNNKNTTTNDSEDSSEKYALVVFLSILSPFMICICCSLLGFVCISFAYWRKNCGDFLGLCPIRNDESLADQSQQSSTIQTTMPISTGPNLNTTLPFYHDLIRFNRTTQLTKSPELPPSYEELIIAKK